VKDKALTPLLEIPEFATQVVPLVFPQQ
jgi:hypothetical protein